MSVFDQSGFRVRFEWGERGLGALAATTDVLIIVDVLSFSTATRRIAAEHVRAVFAGCLRNASAVAAAAHRAGSTVGVIAAGERWPDHSLRPAIEDLVGAGAIISALDASARSPESELAAASFQHVATDLPRYLQACASGRELIESGFADDVRLAAELDVGTTVPVLSAWAFYAYAWTA